MSEYTSTIAMLMNTEAAEIDGTDLATEAHPTEVHDALKTGIPAWMSDNIIFAPHDAIMHHVTEEIERNVDRSKLATGRVGHTKPLDKSVEARNVGWVVYRRRTWHDSKTKEVKIKYENARYSEGAGRLGRWSDKLNPSVMFCTKVAIGKEQVLVVPSTRKVHTLQHPVKDTGITARIIRAVDGDKVAYWSEKMLRQQCPQCKGAGEVGGAKCRNIVYNDGSIARRGCDGRKTIPVYTAWTLGKIRYANYIQMKRRAEVEQAVELVQVEMGQTQGAKMVRETIAIPVAKEHIKFDFDLVNEQVSVYTAPVKSEDWDAIPKEPTVRPGDVIVGDWATAKMLMEQMRAIKRTYKADGELVKLRPFNARGSEPASVHGDKPSSEMDAVWDFMYCENGECRKEDCDNCDGAGGIEEGRILRVDPMQVARARFPDTAAAQLFCQVRLANATNYMERLEVLINRLEAVVKASETADAAE